MVDADRRPTAQEIEELIDLVRRDPASPAFIDLGEAYLALGRPRDAVQVGNVGLEAAPDSLEGRVMLARAYASMHQWKEAQGELLRVVKVDRSNRQGFALLGEVLLRRTDFERAVPVLQHAQNLDPTSPQILSMLKRARAGPAARSAAADPDAGAAARRDRHSGELDRSRSPSVPPPRQRRRWLASVPTAAPQMRTMAIEPAPARRTEPAPSPFAARAAQFAAPPTARDPKQTAPPPMSVEGVRPRVDLRARSRRTRRPRRCASPRRSARTT